MDSTDAEQSHNCSATIVWCGNVPDSDNFFTIASCAPDVRQKRWNFLFLHLGKKSFSDLPKALFTDTIKWLEVNIAHNCVKPVGLDVCHLCLCNLFSWIAAHTAIRQFTLLQFVEFQNVSAFTAKSTDFLSKRTAAQNWPKKNKNDG